MQGSYERTSRSQACATSSSGWLDDGRQVVSQIVLDLTLILRRGGHDVGRGHQPVRRRCRSDDRAVREGPRWRPRPWLAGIHTSTRGSCGRTIVLENGQRLFVGLHDFEAAGHDALERRCGTGVPGRPRRPSAPAVGKQLLAVEIDARQRTQEVGPAGVEPHGLQGGGMRHLLLAKVLLELHRRRSSGRRWSESGPRTWHTRRDATGPRSRRAARTGGKSKPATQRVASMAACSPHSKSGTSLASSSRRGRR